MANERRVRFGPQFTRSFKRLQKKYRHLAEDLKPLLEQLKLDETPGDQIQGVRYTVYKVRVANTDAQRGKSGGYRVLYYLRTPVAVFLIDIYSKSEQEDISTDELRHLVAEIEAEPQNDQENDQE